MPNAGFPLPPPAEESARLAALARLVDLDRGPASFDPLLDELVATAALVCGRPYALVTLLGREWQWFRANRGMEGAQRSTRDVAFCAHTILTDDLLEIPDARQDPRFAENPVVTADPWLRFYAGAPLISSDGHRLGSLCVADDKPGELTALQREVLVRLSRVAVGILERSGA